ncbi:MAG TPA: hypothetical protein PL074_11040 [Thermoflexales bacterium]|nr:hypothetical protein [Thermoflexales bacterium]HQW34522.1 hypothetical protein [Thermoflexales bacterium]HQX76843.1 hypothetical protein [Thermoflexales bacterium]
MLKKIAFVFSAFVLTLTTSMPAAAAQWPQGSEPPKSSESPIAPSAPKVACPRGLGTDASCPIRIRFAAGAFGALVNGRLTRTPDQRFYVVKARAGQKMYLSFLGDGYMRGGITYPNGGGDGPFVSGQTTIELPKTGDYIIYLGQHTMASEPWTGRFTLSVMVQ